MALLKARANQILEHYCKRLEELFSDTDVCVTALFIDVMYENYGYRTTLYDEEGKPVRMVDFCFPYRHHEHMDLKLGWVQAHLYEPIDKIVNWPVELYGEFSSESPTPELLRSTAFSFAEYSYFYLVDGWAGPKYKLNELIPTLKFDLQPKEEGIEWLKYHRKQREVEEIFRDKGGVAPGVVLP